MKIQIKNLEYDIEFITPNCLEKEGLFVDNISINKYISLSDSYFLSVRVEMEENRWVLPDKIKDYILKGTEQIILGCILKAGKEGLIK